MPTTLTIDELRLLLQRGLVIPAHPLALDNRRRFDPIAMRRLTRYYHASGAGGVAAGVHTTQFSIRHEDHGLLVPVLDEVARVIDELDEKTGRRTVKIAGVCGGTRQAEEEAAVARQLGYDAALVSLSGVTSTTDGLIAHLSSVSSIMPILGFYMQEAVGGTRLDRAFWRNAFCIEKMVAVKISPFNRYATLDVVRSLAEVGREGEIALYTGNDDNIVADLVTPHRIVVSGKSVELRIVGGLLGQWACWTRCAVELHSECRRASASDHVPAELLAMGSRLTEANAAIFDAANGFRGSIAGVHEILRHQGLLTNTYCLDPAETLSPGQIDLIDQVRRDYPELADDRFVAEHLSEWST